MNILVTNLPKSWKLVIRTDKTQKPHITFFMHTSKSQREKLICPVALFDTKHGRESSLFVPNCFKAFSQILVLKKERKEKDIAKRNSSCENAICC